MVMNGQSEKAGHPKGLRFLFFTEMWERFGFYLMIGILYLYLTDTTAHGGWGFDNVKSIDIVGSYVALVYLTPFIGGLVADRYLGYSRSILLGGLLMAIGYFMLSIHGSETLLYLSLLTIIIGNGFFKPNISTLLGNLYNREDLRPKKDNAYNIFYMGVNIGAFTCNFVAAYLRNNYTWGAAISAAGVGMLLGVIIFLIGRKHVRSADVMKPAQPGDTPMSKIGLYVFLPAIAAGFLGWIIPGNILGTDSNDAYICACIPVVIFYLSLWFRSHGFDRRRLGTLLTLFALSIIFWNIYNQNSTALTIWAETYSDRQTPKAVEGIVKPFGFLQTVNTQPKQVPMLDKQFRPQSDAAGHTRTETGVDPYFKNLQKEKWPPPGKDLKLLSTEIYQSINPFWIIILTPIVVNFFGWLRSRRRELDTPSKFAWGTIIAGLSSLVMVFACLSTNIYENKVSSAWIFASYGVFTVSELFVSPIGLSLVSKVAPRRFTALMMGGWFLTTSLGGKISGILAGFWDHFDDKAVFFGISAGAAVLAGLILFPLTRRLNRTVVEASAADE